ncbi:4'-phosphopantetheinyl transferase family protein [Chitinophaga silvatica]|nr:4'-phosphopantetheinyl transferase superfamily protein [Chitinophaga silvatica]
MIYFYNAEITKLISSELHAIPPIVQEEAKRYKHENARQAFIAGRLLLQYALKETFPHLQLSDIRYNSYNRPVLDTHYDFNLSHSGNLVVCALGNLPAVGVDIEECKPLNIEEYKDYISDEEWRNLLKAPDPLAVFYGYWTAKEAVVKAAGVGITGEFANISVVKDRVTFMNKQWHIMPVDLFNGYRCHVASAIPETIIIKHIEI